MQKMMERERIIVAGAPGTGKTTDWLTIAAGLPKTTFHVLDPDDGVLRVWKKEFPDVHNLNYYFTPSWFDKLVRYEEGHVGGIAEAFKDLKTKVKPNDWIVVEMLNNLWAMAQGEYVSQVFSTDIGDYFLKARKEMKEGVKNLGALDGWKDWGVINKMHNDSLMIPICYQLPCHVFMTTSYSLIDPKTKEDPEVRAFYGDELVRLDGQKHNGFRAQSLFLQRREGKEFRFKTFLKDRGRKWVEDERLIDFFAQYMMGIAGWNP